VNAQNVPDALRLLKKWRGKARINAGGTDLLGVLRDRILPDCPEVLINIKTASDLDYIEENEEGLRIGAATRLARIASSETVRGTYNVLAEAACAVATPQIRNMGTIGGNICQDVCCWYYRYPHQIGGRILCARKGGQACPAVRGDNRYHSIFNGKKCFAVCPSDIATALAVLDAQIALTRSKGTRMVPVTDFFTPLGNVLRADELVTFIRVPKPPERSRGTFLKFTLRKPVDFAIVSIASLIIEQDGICEDARIALGAVAFRPIRATKAEGFIRGKAINGGTAGEAAQEAVKGAKPLSKNAYKVEILKALIKRALVS
jgi:xanthine dehydrogenase YagS FAD-binding subunit